MATDEAAALVAERESLLATLEALSADEWDAPSDCQGWRVRDVAIHVALAVTINKAALAWGLVRHRGDFNAFMARFAVERGDAPIDELLDEYRSMAHTAKIPPTTKRVDLAIDAFVHHHDIAGPLGRSVPHDDARLGWMLDGVIASGPPVNAQARCYGLCLQATDLDWSHGSGPTVKGPAAALITGACGRARGLGELAGDGLAIFRSR